MRSQKLPGGSRVFLETSHLLFSSSIGGLQSDYHTEQGCVNKLFTGLMTGFSGQEIRAFFFKGVEGIQVWKELILASRADYCKICESLGSL